ncbi:acyl-CoA thioesterase [Roseimaritima sediminicola]|uniref:acyl-CoA thioesterase n=1 Tax=Roseimaritima sediminicola TaxID=2662066 RepID=UPI001F2D3A38|nr:thioesterase family protein [Roseimaritima sediminicola]
MPPTPRFVHTRRVEFRDTDAAGIVHFSAFFPMMEEAEHALLRSLGLSVMQPDGPDAHLAWPRVAAHCDYQAAARFEDELTIEVAVEHLGGKSVRYGFAFRRDQTPIARGQLTAVCCRLSDQGLESVPIPADIRRKLAPK